MSTHTFCVKYLISKILPFKRDVAKYCIAGQATDDIMAHAEYLRLKIHTQNK